MMFARVSGSTSFVNYNKAMGVTSLGIGLNWLLGLVLTIWPSSASPSLNMETVSLSWICGFFKGMNHWVFYFSVCAESSPV